MTILPCLAENKVEVLGVCAGGRSLRPLAVSEQVGIVNEVAFSWILTVLSAGLPHSLIGAIGLGFRPDRAAAEEA